jgi:hypothetical protein
MEKLDETHKCEDNDENCSGSVKQVIDPYIQDVHDEIKLVWLCDWHEYESARDI